MTLEEAIKHCEEQANKNISECSKEHAQLAEWLKELKRLREPGSQDLEEAAYRYAIKCEPLRNSYGGTTSPNPEIESAIIYGANWQKQQMMKDAVNAVVDFPLIGYDFPNIYPDYRELKIYCDRHIIKDDDKVKLIIIKDD